MICLFCHYSGCCSESFALYSRFTWRCVYTLWMWEIPIPAVHELQRTTHWYQSRMCKKQLFCIASRHRPVRSLRNSCFDILWLAIQFGSWPRLYMSAQHEVYFLFESFSLGTNSRRIGPRVSPSVKFSLWYGSFSPGLNKVLRQRLVAKDSFCF